MKMMGKIKQNANGFSAVEIAFVLVVITGLCLSGYLLFSSQKTGKQASSTNPATTTNTTAKSTSSVYAVLSPATVPSKTAECSQQISFSSNGNSGPITCNNEDLNVTEWDSLSALEPKVMTLGYSATSAEVQSALCADVHANISNPIEETTYQIAALYYGWIFTTNPSSVITDGSCVNLDD
jgi:hypothetical protein